MTSSGYDSTIQFRAGAEKTAADVLNRVHVGGVNTSELAREGLKEMLGRLVTDEDKIQIYELYSRGEVEEEAVRLLLGDEFDAMVEDAEEFQRAMDVDTSGMFQE